MIKQCPTCNLEFEAVGKQRFCSRRCQSKDYYNRKGRLQQLKWHHEHPEMPCKNKLPLGTLFSKDLDIVIVNGQPRVKAALKLIKMVKL